MDVEDTPASNSSKNCALCPQLSSCNPFPNIEDRLDTDSPGEKDAPFMKSETTMQSCQSFSVIMASPLLPKPQGKRMIQCIDGNQAAVTVAYAFSDSTFVFPITPSTPMGELADEWAANGVKNVFNNVLQVNMMESEAGAAGGMHGALLAGSFCTTFTASQGLLLMIPNMYKIAGELLPCVMHVAARTVSTHSLSIFGDHADVMGVRQTGWLMICSESAQAAYDLAIVSHLATLDARIPIVHFFDGFRTSHEITKVEMLQAEELKALLPADLVRAHRDRALHPNHPEAQGGVVGPECWFQMAEASNPFYRAAPEKLEKWLDVVGGATGRHYHFFEVAGHPQAEHVIVIMGSAGMTVEEYCKSHPEEKIGVIRVRVFRPWSRKHFLATVPESVKRIAVLDRVKEAAADGEPLFTDVCTSLHRGGGRFAAVEVVGGRYGIGMKEFTPADVEAVYRNMKADKMIESFTAGIVDDITFLSLPTVPVKDILPPNTTQCVFYGLGSDGTVGANKAAIKMIGEESDNYAQGNFEYDSKKSGNCTTSHLRFGLNPIYAPYVVVHADYVAIHCESFIYNLPMILSKLKHGGTVVLNTVIPITELDARLPISFRHSLVERQAKFYIIDAQQIGERIGVGKKINMIMQTIFFYLTNVIPFTIASMKLKSSIAKMFKLKGQHVIDMNQRAVDEAVKSLQAVPIPPSWAQGDVGKGIEMIPLHGGEAKGWRKQFVEDVVYMMNTQRGNDIPVSKFAPGGTLPTGTSFSEKRGIAPHVPLVDMDKCTQCNYCSLVCPHAAIRPFLLTPLEVQNATPTIQRTAKDAVGEACANYRYRVQVSPLDCVGCDLCSKVCPSAAITMRPLQASMDDGEGENWKYVSQLPVHGNEQDKTTIKGSQFQRPLMEFSGACPGCGETAYIKLLTQLFGDRLIIANATGCSAVWGASITVPYAVNNGVGPAFSHSLFEDNAEFGFGLLRGQAVRGEQLLLSVDHALKNPEVVMSEALRRNLEQFSSWKHTKKQDSLLIEGRSAYKTLSDRIVALLANERVTHTELETLWKDRDFFMRLAMWTVGGDGWAYDIGFGGLDHVLASGENVKCLVLDTEMYSNTGGQISKASHRGVLQKFAAAGKPSGKKELGQYAISTYRNVYVASICINANHQQALRAMLEAEAYPGPALVIAYCPCIAHGYLLTDALTHCQQAVETGYWPLYRFDPSLEPAGSNPFQLDSKKISTDLSKMISAETRFTALARRNPEVASALNAKLKEEIGMRAKQVQFMAKYTCNSPPGEKSASSGGAIVLYGSETGHAEELAWQFVADLEVRGMKSTLSTLDDFNFSELPAASTLIILVSTCGLGDFPQNARKFWSSLKCADLSITLLKDVKYAVFGLGDSTYAQFCFASEQLDLRLAALGAQRLIPRGAGDDRDEDRYFTAWEAWEPSVLLALQLPRAPLEQKAPPPPYEIEISKGGEHPLIADSSLVPKGAIPLTLKENRRLTPQDYDREIRHFEFELQGSPISYCVGDTLAVYPKNDNTKVENFCRIYKLSPKDELRITRKAGAKYTLPSEVNVRQLFSTYVNIFGKPSKKFFEQMLCFCTDDSERASLTQLLSDTADGAKAWKKLQGEYTSYADALQLFPNSRPTLAHLLNMVPPIAPRSYSISSAPALSQGALQLTVVKVDWQVPSTKEVREGTCTSYLSKAIANQSVNVAVRKSAIAVPQDETTPIIMVGTGTGIAPWRAMTQSRVHAKLNGRKVGPVVLFFGARNSKAEFLYESEFKKYVEMGILELHTAFSRDQPQKIYVQNRILEQGAKVCDLIMNHRAYFYVCGSAVSIPEEVLAAMQRVMMTHGHMDQIEAEGFLKNMRQERRYIVEAWA